MSELIDRLRKNFRDKMPQWTIQGEAADELDRLQVSLDGVLAVSKPLEIDGEQWIAIPRAAWIKAAKARNP